MAVKAKHNQNSKLETNQN